MEYNNNEIFMNPYTDFGFKKLFGREPNKDILISFLNALFDGDRAPIVDLQYLNTEQLGPYYGERSSVFDVYCKTADDDYFVVEMQRSDQPYFKDRTVYYASAVIAQQGPRGPWNYELKDVCVIGILDFVFPNNEYGKDSYLHKVMLKDTEDHHLVYDKLTFYYLEMPKFTKKEDELETMQDKWLYVVKNICYLLKQPKELQEKVFTKFFEEARIGMFTGEERFAYMVSQKHYWDNMNTLNYSFEKGERAGIKKGIEKGIKKGRELGREETLKAVAQKMLSQGMSRECVLEVTGLTEI